MSRYQVPLEKTPIRVTPVSSQSPTTGIAFGKPTPKLETMMSVDGPSQMPLPLLSRYQVPFEKTPILSPRPALPGQLPTTGIAFGRPTPKFGITLSTDGPSQAPLPFMSRYQVPLEKTPIFVVPEPFQSPVTGTTLGRPVPKSGIIKSPLSQAPSPFMSKYQVPLEKTPIFGSLNNKAVNDKSPP